MNAVLPQIALDNSPAEAAEIILSSWQRTHGSREWYRSRARTCWHDARRIRRDIDVHGWNFDADETDELEEYRRELRREAAGHVRMARRLTQEP